MNILKFGGTSVANSSSLQSVIEIVKSQQQESVVVVSALGGITNLLIDFLYRASQKDDTYRADFKIIRERHLEPIEALLPKLRNEPCLRFLHLEKFFHLSLSVHFLSIMELTFLYMTPHNLLLLQKKTTS
jgi:aspartokinase